MEGVGVYHFFYMDYQFVFPIDIFSSFFPCYFLLVQVRCLNCLGCLSCCLSVVSCQTRTVLVSWMYGQDGQDGRSGKDMQRVSQACAVCRYLYSSRLFPELQRTIADCRVFVLVACMAFSGHL